MIKDNFGGTWVNVVAVWRVKEYKRVGDMKDLNWSGTYIKVSEIGKDEVLCIPFKK